MTTSLELTLWRTLELTNDWGQWVSFICTHRAHCLTSATDNDNDEICGERERDRERERETHTHTHTDRERDREICSMFFNSSIRLVRCCKAVNNFVDC